MNEAQRREFFTRLRALNPAPRTELEYSTPFELLVAVILSAQATDKSVNLATRELFRVASTPAAMLALGVDGLVPFIRSIGLYQTKARNVIATCRQLVGTPRRTGAADARGARSAARRRSQDRERRAQHGVRASDHGRRYAHLPCGESHGTRAGSQCPRGRGPFAASRAHGIHARRAPLADPAWALHLQGA